MKGATKTIVWIGIMLAILFGVGAIFVEPFTVPMDDARLMASLEPNVHGGDVLLIRRQSGADLGHLVRCPDPTPGVDRWMMARVVATESQTIMMSAERMSLTWRMQPSRSCDISEYMVTDPSNGQRQKLVCRMEDIGRGTPTLSYAEASPSVRTYKVESNRVFLISDNRHFHNDSQDLGQIDPSTCQGVVARLWSAAGWGDSKNRFTVLY